MKTLVTNLFLIVLLFGIIISCQEEPIPIIEPENIEPELSEVPELTQKVNKFIKDGMEDVYLWYKELPDINSKNESNSKEYFKKLLFVEDKWSFITEDVTALENSFEGKEKSYGWSLAFGRFSETRDIFALVEFVYPETPAFEAGIKRGDIIFRMNDAVISDDNYLDLLNGENLSFSYGQYIENQGISNTKSINLEARELTLNPVLFTNVIQHGGHKIGYIFYAQYISNYNSNLDAAFQSLMDQQITDLVIDLRYNPGGSTSAAQHFCSSLAPINIVNANSKLVTFQWNDKYQKYWEDKNITGQLQINLLNNVPVKMGLNKLHVLTGSGTASASELSITGLRPYMDIIMVGDTTYGKYTASITVKPEMLYENLSYYGEFKNWGLQPIVIRYANSQGVTDFKDGFIPDIVIDDELFEGIPLGNKNESLLKAAIEDITGTEIIARKSASIDIPYTLFDRGFSKFDKNKREVVYDGFDRSVLNK